VNWGQGAGHTDHRRFGVLCLLGYVVLSWAVRFDMEQGEQIASLVYPLDTFSMYAQAPSPEISHLLVRDAGGAVHPVTDFRAFDCDAPVSGVTARCSDHHMIRYLYEETIKYIQTHPGSGSEDAELIFRTWALQAGAPVTHQSDCVLAHCRVAR
jgi:hypothetical protein